MSVSAADSRGYFSERRRSSATRSIIAANKPLITRQMDLQLMAKTIVDQGGILTRDEENILWQRYIPEEERKSQMLEFISQKGEEGMAQFIRCLRESGERAGHRGHIELADTLEKQI